MSIVRKFVNNFTTGEISPGVQQRLDLQKYAAACQRVENAVVQPHGGVAKRHGLQYVAKPGKDGLLIPFQYAAGDGAVLFFSNQMLDVYVDGELQSGDISTPYVLADLAKLKFVQSGDKIYLTHHGYMPHVLSRSLNGSTVTWSLEIISFGTTTPTPNKPSATDNGGTGGQIATIVTTGSSYREIFYRVSAVDGDGQESLPSSALKVKIKTSWPAGGIITLTWKMPNGTSSAMNHYIIYKKVRGQYGRIGIVDHSGNTATANQTFEDDNIDPDLSSAPKSENLPFDTSQGSGNQPGCVSIYQQRLVFARTNNAQQTVFMTETGIWNSFGKHEPLIDSDSIEVTMDSRQMNEIRHIVLLKNGVIFTSGAEYVMSPGRNSDAITPTSIRFDLQSYWGCSNVPPLVIGKNILFIQRDGRVIRDFAYNFSSDSYEGGEMTIMSNHLFTSPIRDWAYQQSPNGCIWVVLEDGSLLSFTYMPEQEVYAWARHNSRGAKFRSVTVVNEGNKDMVYFLLERIPPEYTTDIFGEFYIERMEAAWDYGSPSEDAVFLDASAFFEFNTPVDVIRMLPTAEDNIFLSPLIELNSYNYYYRLEKEATWDYSQGDPTDDDLRCHDFVAVIDGSVYTGISFSDDEVGGTDTAIHLPVAGKKIIIGLPYKMTVETVDPEISSQDGAIVADKRSVAEVAVAVRETADLKIGYDEQHLETLKFPYPANLGDAPVLYTGYLKAPLAGSYRPTASMVMTSDSPLPCTILSVMSKISIG